MASLADRKAPGVFGVLFGAGMSVILGVLLAGVHLASQPVEVVRTAPKEPQEGVVYFIEGASGSGAGKTWESKRESLAAGESGEVAFTEAELNAWSAASFEKAEVDEAKKNSTVLILAGTPNFRIDGGALQLGMVNTVNFFGTEAPLVLQAKGGFEKSGSGWRFQASEALLGRLPLHKVPALLPLVAARFGAGNLPAEVEKVLASASVLAVREGELVVGLP